MPEERKLVSVLFADVVGSTAMGAQHDPEVIRITLARAFERLAAAIASHGGTVEKFIGDEVMAVFGIPTAHDDDADRAVRAAFALQSAIAELNTTGGLQLALRIGVNTGEVVTGGGTPGGQLLVTGSVVNESARLRGSAAPGEIVAGALTRRLTSRTVRYAEARRVEARGLGTIEASTALALESELPEQRRGLEGMRAPLIGRDEELRLLVEAHGRAVADGRAYLATVFGAPGAGKSRLSEEFAASIGRERVRYGRCLPYGQGITYWAMQAMLRGDAGILATDSRDAAVAKLRAAVAAAIDAPDDVELVHRRLSVIAGLARAEEALADVAEDELAEELRWGVRRFFEGRAAAGPLVLLFEDIHWAEPGLLDLIENLADWGRGPIFVLCLARPDLLDVRPAWGGGKTNATAIDLQPLTGEETRDLIGALLAIDGLPDALRDEVVARAEGNPLYVEEFLRMLMETDQIEHRAGRWVATTALGSLALPPSLQGLIAARLDRVPADTKRALQHAAVIGRFFSTAALTALLGSPPADALRDAARRDLVIASDDRAIGGGRLHRFKHVLIRDVAYGAVPKSERAALHDRYGRWYQDALGERRDEFLEILGYHAEQAFLLARELGLPDAKSLGERALALLLPAAKRSRKRADFPGALSLFERAAAVADAVAAPAATRLECHGFAALAAGDMRMTPEARERVAALLAEARAAGPSEILVLLLRRHAFLSEQSIDRSRTLLDEAIEAARAVGDAELVAVALLARANPEIRARDLAATAGRATAAIAHMRATGATELLPAALNILAMTHVQSGRFGQARPLRDQGLAIAEASGARWARMLARFGLAGLEFNRGAVDAAAEHMRLAVALATEMGSPDQLDFNRMWQAGFMLRESGRLDDAKATLEEILPRTDVERDVAKWGLARDFLAHVLVELGEVERAEAVALEAYGLRHRANDPASPSFALARVRAAQGRVVEAERLFLESIGHPHQWHDPSGTATGTGLAVARRHYAEFLLRQGRAADARAQLEKARAFYADPEAEPRRRQIEELLRRCDEVAAR